MGRLQVRRRDGEITVNAPPDEVFALIRAGARDWAWKVHFETSPTGQGLSFVVKGSLWKDNSAETHLELFSTGLDETVIAAAGSRGQLMESVGGNVFGVGVKKFRNRVLDAIEAIVQSA